MKLILMAGILASLLLVQVSASGPARYAYFVGNLTREGKPAPVGTEITAVNSTGGEYAVEYGFAYKLGEYGTGNNGPIHVGEGSDGGTISFKINGFSAAQVTFCSLMSCGVQQLDLSCTNCNHAPTLINGAVDQASGDVDATFRYTVTYSDADNDAPIWVNVSIDGVSYKMQGNYSNATEINELKNSREYWYETTLALGSHNYKFQAYDGFDSMETELQQGPTVFTPGENPGDINGDGTVGLTDLAMLGQAWDSSTGEANWNAAADFNLDGSITLLDLALLGQNWGNTY